MFKKLKLNIDYDKFLQADFTIHEGSCISHQVHELTDIHKQYGAPTDYEYVNTRIHQLWYTKDDIDFDQTGNQLGIEVVTVSTIKQPPGCVIPLHRDTFYQINKRFPERTELKVRANVHMEDYSIGHFIQYSENGEELKNFTHWKQGDVLLWDSSVIHLSANAGMQYKYTMQISGFLRED
jgi:hypothetical protein